MSVGQTESIDLGVYARNDDEEQAETGVRIGVAGCGYWGSKHL